MIPSKFVVICTKLPGSVRLNQPNAQKGTSAPNRSQDPKLRQKIDLKPMKAITTTFERGLSFDRAFYPGRHPVDQIFNTSAGLQYIRQVCREKARMAPNLHVLAVYWSHCLNLMLNKIPEVQSVLKPRYMQLRGNTQWVGDEMKGVVMKDMPGSKRVEMECEAKRKKVKNQGKAKENMLSKIVKKVCGNNKAKKGIEIKTAKCPPHVQPQPPAEPVCPPPIQAVCAPPCVCMSPPAPACPASPTPCPAPPPMPTGQQSMNHSSSASPPSCPPPDKTIKKLKSRCAPKTCNKPPPPQCPPAPPTCTPSPCLPMCRPPGNPPCPGPCPCPPIPNYLCPCPTPCCFPQMEALQFDPATKCLNFFMLNAPTSIHKDEILVQVVYSGVAQSDIQIMEGALPCRNCPTILGHEFSGVACAVGSAVTHIRCGDCIAIDPYAPCHICRFCTKGKYLACPTDGLNNGIGIFRDGGWAEFVVVDKNQVYRVPPTISLDHAALLQPLACVVSGYSKLDLHIGQDVLIQGAGIMGCLWAAALHWQGHRSVAVCDMCESKRKQFEGLCTDFCIVTPEQACELRPDVVIDCTGAQDSLERAVDILNPRGQLCIFGTTNPCDEVKIKPYEMVKKELKVIGVPGNTYSFSKAMDLMELLGCRYLDYKKLGIQTFQFGQYEGAFKMKKSGEVSKIVFKVDNSNNNNDNGNSK